jgi:hypothetical protein
MVSDNCLSLPLEDGIYAMLWEHRNGGGIDDDASPAEGVENFFVGSKPSKEFTLHGIDDKMEEMMDHGYQNMQIGRQNC